MSPEQAGLIINLLYMLVVLQCLCIIISFVDLTT